MSIQEKAKKQRIMAVIAGLLILAGVLLIVAKLQKGRGTKQVKKGGNVVKIDETQGELEKKWYVEAERQLSEVNQKLSDVSKTLEEISRRLAKHEKEIEKLKEEVKQAPKVKVKELPKEAKPEKKAKKAEAKVSELPPPPPPPSPSAFLQQKKKKGKKGELPQGIQKISFAEQLKEREQEAEKKKLEILRKFYVPSGTFVSGILLSGVDAPTGVGAKRDTIPVLITLTDNSILPNDWRYDLKDCRIIGEAYGDLSSERVYIRTDYMSCVDDDGNVYDFTLDGYVAGEDGKVGLRGRVVSKQGALIARALLAGFFEGAGNILQTSATTTTITGSGVVSTVKPNQVARAGVFAGVASAAKKLSDYFMNLVDQTFPVIEIGAGRKITVVVQKGKWIQKVGKTEQVEVVEKGSKKGGKK
jgi:conjugal transfer pilus assembly protein TraB